MTKILSLLSIFTLFINYCEIAWANEYKFFKTKKSIVNTIPVVKFYGVSSSGSETLLNTWQSSNSNVESFNVKLQDARIDQYEGKIYIEINEFTSSADLPEYSIEYDFKNNSVSQLDNLQAANIQIYPEGIDQMIKEKSDGSIHIGENSLITKEANGKQELYANDANEQSIPINITNGSDLQINGISVQGQINKNTNKIETNTSNISKNTSNIFSNSSNIKSLGQGVAGSTALTAALSALPQSSENSKHSCGIGTGSYSSRFALGFGCASKLNKRIDINAGGSYVFGGSKSYGSGILDAGVIKAGLILKLGKLKKAKLISSKDKKIIDTKILKLEQDNKNLKVKNNEIISQNQNLQERLERLEKIAIMESKTEDIAIYKLK